MKKICKHLILFVFLSALFASLLYSEESPKNQSNLSKINTKLASVIFYDVSFGKLEVPDIDKFGAAKLDSSGKRLSKLIRIPLVVAILFLGAIFFTFFYRFINFRAFRHSINVIAGKYDNPNDHGEISHFQALTSALSATVGLGNIAGVALAIQMGGPGAVVWMIIMALFGMSSKFSSCTLAQLYRQINKDGSISGGPMYYLDIGLSQMGSFFKPLGKFLGLLYACLVMGGSIGGGNMFQANQTAEIFRNTFGLSSSANLVIGIIMSVLVGMVILGGIKRIASVTSKVVPIMCGIYVMACLFVIIANISRVPESLALILNMAFSSSAIFGGIFGVMVIGIQRAAFSNEAGLGSASIAHSAAKTKEPVREGIVAMIGPFIDTIIVCLMTSLVVIVTGVWNNPEIVSQGSNIGVTLTSEAFKTVIPWFPYLLTVCVCLFAFSTMISWCYYGERGWIYLLDHFNGAGLKSVVVFRIVFVLAIIVGAVNSLSDVIDFTDLMILSLALPNIIGSAILAPKVWVHAKDYMKRLTSGEMAQYS